MLQPLPRSIPFFGGSSLPHLYSSSLACQVFSWIPQLPSAAFVSECVLHPFSWDDQAIASFCGILQVSRNCFETTFKSFHGGSIFNCFCRGVPKVDCCVASCLSADVFDSYSLFASMAPAFNDKSRFIRWWLFVLFAIVVARRSTDGDYLPGHIEEEHVRGWCDQLPHSRHWK